LQVFGLTFPNPIGLAAGFDKQGEAMEGLLDAGMCVWYCAADAVCNNAWLFGLCTTIALYIRLQALASLKSAR
jgi:hypothetical protein